MAFSLARRPCCSALSGPANTCETVGDHRKAAVIMRHGGTTLKPVLAMIVVGLTPRHLGPLTPRLSALARDGAVATLDTVTPAVTCSAQATFMTGTLPQD